MCVCVCVCTVVMLTSIVACVLLNEKWLTAGATIYSLRHFLAFTHAVSVFIVCFWGRGTTGMRVELKVCVS